MLGKHQREQILLLTKLKGQALRVASRLIAVVQLWRLMVQLSVILDSHQRKK